MIVSMVMLFAGSLPIDGALRLGRAICGVVFLFSIVKAFRHYNRGDMFDGHAHFRGLVYAGIVSLILFAAFGAVIKGLA